MSCIGVLWRRLASAGLLAACAAFGACSTVAPRADDPYADPSAMSRDDQAQTRTRSPAELEGALAERRPSPQYMTGRGAFVDQSATSAVPPIPNLAAGDVTIAYVDAGVRDVIRSVAGDVLGISFAIDEGVQGRVTFQSEHAMRRADVLPALETVLQSVGVDIDVRDGVYTFVPAGRAGPGGVSIAFGQEPPQSPGTAIQIVPLRYISAAEAQRLLQPFAPEGGILKTDTARNLIYLTGSAQDIARMQETLRLFDVDWLANMSFAIFYPRYVDATTLEGELLQLFSREDSPTEGLVEFMPVDRMNALIAMSAQPGALTEVGEWIARLDKEPYTAGRQLYFYSIQYANAAELTSALNGVFGRQPLDATFDQPNQDMDEQGLTQSDVSLFQTEGDAPRIVTDKRNNALIIYATPEQYALIDGALKRMDVPVEQVLIEASIAEVMLTDQLKFGLQWFAELGDSRVTLSDARSGAVSSAFPGFSFSYVGSDARVALNALATLTDVNVISSPKIMVLNNRTAMLQVGDEVPIATQSAVSVIDPDAPIVNQVQFRETGVILEVTPRISASGVVVLDVTQEVSDVVATTTSGIDSPTIRQRRFESTIAVEDGETIALGGLFRESNNRNNRGVPVLKDLPIVGHAFSTDDNTQTTNELIVFLTPHIVRTREDARHVTDELRVRLQRLRARNLAD